MIAVRARALLALAAAISACGSSPRPVPPATDGALLPDVRTAKGRPPVVLVSRRGDPTAALALAVTTAGLEGGAEPAVALAGVLEARLSARGFDARVVPSWDGFRASILVASAEQAAGASIAMRTALVTPIGETDLAWARKKVAALGERPLRDRSLARWAECVGSPYSLETGRPAGELSLTQLESLRASAVGLPRVALAVAGERDVGERVASAVARGPAWSAAAPLPSMDLLRRPAFGGIGDRPRPPRSFEVSVYDAPASAASAGPVVHATLDLASSSAAVAVAEALGDPRGPLASRLSALEPPFRLREVTGTAHAAAGCVGVILEAPAGKLGPKDLADRVADAVALVQLEAQVHLAEGGARLDGRTLARRTGDAREAAERGAWWALATARPAQDPAVDTSGLRGSAVLGLPIDRNEGSVRTLDPSREVLASAVERAIASWQKPAVESRTRVESGQGEAWILLASPCGTSGEAESDAGITALFTVTALEMARSSPEARVEPWVVADGAGLLAHGPSLPGETPAAHARRLADVVARSFASEPLSSAALSRARANLLQHDAQSDGPALEKLASALAPQHPSWVVPWGRADALSRSSEAAVRARAQALREGRLRLAVVANDGAGQALAAVRAADRWVERHGDDRKACVATDVPPSPRPGTYAVATRPGARPEAYLAFPLPPREEATRDAAAVLAAALEAPLTKALGDLGEGSLRVVGWPQAPALVVRLTAADATLDSAVMQARALVDRVRKGAMTDEELGRATAAAARGRVAAALDPRARVVATWRGEAIPDAGRPFTRTPSATDLRTFALRHLGEDALVVVAARPPRSGAAP